jgi:hypothetical protein
LPVVVGVLVEIVLLWLVGVVGVLVGIVPTTHLRLQYQHLKFLVVLAAAPQLKRLLPQLLELLTQ